MTRLLLLPTLAAAALAQHDVTVRLYSLHPPEQAHVNGQVLNAGGNLVRTAGKTVRKLDFFPESVLFVEGAPRLRLSHPLTVTAYQGRLRMAVTMPLEDYVGAVMAGESGGVRPEETLKAMAIVARTYAAANRGRHRSEGYDFCDTTHCQDLRLAVSNARAEAAVRATEGELLWYRGSLARVFYHQDCGGRLESAHEVWPEIPSSYLTGREDRFCVQRGRYTWQASLAKQDLVNILGLSASSPVQVIERTQSGRVRKLRVGSLPVDIARFELTVWRSLGWEKLRSRLFSIVERPEGILLQGYGAGHGVGLCQTGAARRGESGHSHQEILEFYFPGTVIGLNARGFRWRRLSGERVQVEALDEAKGRDVAALADRLLGEAERRSTLRYNGQPRLRVYPSVASFRDATGEPGWVAASTRGGVVRLQPPDLLRSRGALEPVLLHELLHLVVEAHAHPSTQEWFREGLVLHLGGDAPHHQVAAHPEEAVVRSAYRDAHTRVKALAATHGEQKLLDWLRSGLPAGVLQFQARDKGRHRQPR